jgi:hypothetical protein
MDDLQIVYSDDEDDIIEKIYFVCDISEEKQGVTPDIDLEDLLFQEEKQTQSEEIYTTKTENIIQDQNVGKKALDSLRKAYEQNIPGRYVFYDTEDNLISLKDFLSGKDSLEGLESILRNYFRISISDYIMIYYLANDSILDENTLMDRLNELESISDKKFDLAQFNSYKRETKIVIEENMKILEEKISNVEDFFQKINSIPYSNTLEDIEKTLQVTNTDIEIFCRDGEYLFDMDSGTIVFDNMKTTSKIPLIVYVGFNSYHYKINEDTTNLVDILDKNYYEEKQKNHIYLFVKVTDIDTVYIKIIDIDLDLSKISFSYPGNTLTQVKDHISRVIPNIIYVDEKKTSIKGSFEINFVGYDELRIRYLCLFDDIFSKFLYVKESSNPRSLRKTQKYYFRTYEEDNSFSDHSVSFDMDRIHMNRYRLNFKSKIMTKGSINEFILVISKLITYYNNVDFKDTFLEIIETRYTGPEGIGLGGEFIENVDEKILKINSKKIDNLLRQAPGMFPKTSYGKSCPCSRQPVIIEEKDVHSWKEYTMPNGKNKNVVLFPPEESQQKSKKYNFVCPENEYPYLYFMQNPKYGEKYPILPCCGSTENSQHINQYDIIRKDEIEYRSKINERRVRETKLKTFKILSPGQKGVLVPDVIEFLTKVKTGSYIRKGVIKNNTSTFIHCVIVASSHLEKYIEYINPKNIDEIEKIKTIIGLRENYLRRDIRGREELVNMIRKNITSFVNLSVTSQETYEYDISQVEDFIQDREKVFDSKLYYKVLEKMFLLNIVVFSFEEEMVEIEKPNHVLYHIRELNDKFPVLFLFKHITAKSVPTYELIENEEKGPSSDPYLRGKPFFEKIKSFIRSQDYTVGICGTKDFDMVKNAYSGIPWEYILGDYKITSQDINDSGRTIKINIVSSGSQRLSLFVKPTYPLNVKISKLIYEGKKQQVINLFGDDYRKGSSGLWYQVKKFEYGIFIPCVDTKENKNKPCFEYELLKNIFNTNKDLINISMVKKNAGIVKQLILWLWNLSPEEDVDEWFENYVTLMEGKRIVDMVNTIPIKIDYRFPQNITSTEDGINYLEDYIPLIFSLGKINLYKELEENMKRYIKNYQISLRGYPKIPNKSIVNILSKEKDFKRYRNTKIIIGRKRYEQYYEKVKNTKDDIQNIEDINSYRNGVFAYVSKNEKIFFLIQNTISDRKTEAIFVCLIWKKYQINIGYDVDKNTLWKYFSKYPMVKNLLEYDDREIIQTAIEETSLRIDNIEDALYYLAKQKIPISSEKLQKLQDSVSIRYRTTEGFYEEIKENTDTMIDIWIYGNGVYAAMLSLN